jgi:hypothetical protein
VADLTGPEREPVAALARRLNGLIVWSSNRSGHHQRERASLFGVETRRFLWVVIRGHRERVCVVEYVTTRFPGIGPDGPGWRPGEGSLKSDEPADSWGFESAGTPVKAGALQDPGIRPSAGGKPLVGRFPVSPRRGG